MRNKNTIAKKKAINKIHSTITYYYVLGFFFLPHVHAALLSVRYKLKIFH